MTLKALQTSLWILFLLVAIMIYSCNESGDTSGQVMGTNTDQFSNYNLTPLDGGMQLAENRDISGVLIERGYVKDGKKHGQWVRYFPDGGISSLTPYQEGKVYGAAIQYSNRMMVEKITTMEGDILQGPSLKYDNGRIIERLHYKNGKLDGTQRFYFESGMEKGKIQRAVDYKDGVLEGKMRYYDADGNVTVEYQYENGKRVGGGMVDE